MRYTKKKINYFITFVLKKVIHPINVCAFETYFIEIGEISCVLDK